MDQPLESKIFQIDQLAEVCRVWKKQNKNIVFTNGCFDILHEGHVRYLWEAKSFGDKLIIGLNSDHSVNKLKGPNRPINPEESRAIVLAGLSSVDAICVFTEATPLLMISRLIPDILVKGGDWKIDEIVGSDEVIKHGGKVFSLSFHKGYSTTLIEEKIKNQNL
jgi:rfaE bifunctional protein nucleotidyltransferase chain/domain